MSATAFDALVLAKPSLSGFWLGEGANGAAAFNDESANNLDGTAAASGLTYNAAGGLANEVNTAVAFDGTSDPATIPDNAVLDVGDGPFWMLFWFQRTATQSVVQTLLTKGTNAPQARITSSNLLEFRRGNGGTLILAGPTITDTSWHFAIMQKDGAIATIDVDGVEVANTTTSAVTLSDTNTTLRIGSAAAGAQRFPGSMARIAIGKGATLSAAERAELWRVAKGIIGPALSSGVALSPSARKARTLVPAATSDVSLALGSRKTRGIAAAGEANAAQPLAPRRQRAIGPAGEGDVSQACTARKQRALTPALEADTAQALSPRKQRAIGPGTESDASRAVATRKQRALPPAIESDTALVLGKLKAQAIAPAIELDGGQDATGVKGVSIDAATETSTAHHLTASKRSQVGTASDTSSARPLGARKRVSIGLAGESDSSSTLRYARSAVIAPAVGSSTAPVLRVRKSRAIGPGLESDAAIALTNPTVVGLVEADARASPPDASSAVDAAEASAGGTGTEAALVGAAIESHFTAGGDR